MRLFILFLLLLASPVKAQDKTVPYLDSVPVMKGFDIMADSLLVFDKPEGQITEVSLICQGQCPTKQNINTYYTNAFDMLGWNSDQAGYFAKDKKRIRLDYSGDSKIDTPVIITFHSKS